jgi:hypothetical protein
VSQWTVVSVLLLLAKVNRGITLKWKKAANSEIKLGLPCMVPDLVYKFQMISFKEITTKTSYILMT